MSKYSKKEIVKGIINLDIELYKHLDGIYRKEVIKYILNNSGTREDGEELYNDVIFEIYLKIKRGRYSADGRGTFKGYFWTIIKRRWIDKLRGQKPKPVPLPPDEPIPSTPYAGNLKNERIVAIMKCIERLSPDEQEYIRLYYFAKKSIQAIADYFGTTYGTVQQKLHTIREKIRKMIADDFGFGQDDDLELSLY